MNIVKRRLNSLLADILRAQTADAMQSSPGDGKMTILTKSGAQEVSRESLKEQVEAAVAAQRRRLQK